MGPSTPSPAEPGKSLMEATCAPRTQGKVSFRPARKHANLKHSPGQDASDRAGRRPCVWEGTRAPLQAGMEARALRPGLCAGPVVTLSRGAHAGSGTSFTKGRVAWAEQVPQHVAFHDVHTGSCASRALQGPPPCQPFDCSSSSESGFWAADLSPGSWEVGRRGAGTQGQIQAHGFLACVALGLTSSRAKWGPRSSSRPAQARTWGA